MSQCNEMEPGGFGQMDHHLSWNIKCLLHDLRGREIGQLIFHGNISHQKFGLFLACFSFYPL